MEASHGIVKDWNGSIDEMEILEPLNLNAYSRVIVADLDTSATPLPPTDENTYEPTKIVLKSSSDIFTNALRDQFKEAKSSLEIVGPVNEVTGAEPKTLLVKGKVTEMNPGSQALRYWVGFGAGKSRVEVAGEIIDAQSNKPLVRFKHAKASGIGAFGGDYQKFLTDDTHDVGEDIGKMLLYFATPSNEKTN
ncbi:MAG: DUF4410 domain-containing protein [Desulfuromonadaceae bacterium]|nr:DUF4410 domain-containing protein [Desulfuromonadaceae bacterium]